MTKKWFIQILLVFLALSLLGQATAIAQDWEWQNPLPTGNKIYCFDFVDSLTGWFGSSAGTLLHTIDGGKTWQIEHIGRPGLYIISVDFVDDNTGWAIGQDGGSRSTLFHTTDGGRKWTVQGVDSVYDFIRVVFRNQREGCAATYGGRIYYSADGGKNWMLVYQGKGPIQSLVFPDARHGWAKGPGEVPLLYTTDGGKSWAADTTKLFGARVFFVDSLHGWIGGQNRLYRTIDGGETWLSDLPPITDDSLHSWVNQVFFVDSLHGWVNTAENGVYRTTDGGWKWEPLAGEVDFSGWDFGDAFLFFTPLSGWMGFSRTRDGGKTLVHMRKGFTFSMLMDVDFVDKNTGWVVGGGKNLQTLIAKTTDGGKSWHIQKDEIGPTLQKVVAVDAKRVWAMSFEGKIFTTSNGGETWTAQDIPSQGESIYLIDIDFVDSLAGWIVGGKTGMKGIIFHTEDGGATWTDQAPADAGVVDAVDFIDRYEGWAVIGGFIYHTTDGGQSWTPQFDSRNYSPFILLFLNRNTGWAAGEKYLLHTRDGGTTWSIFSHDSGEFPGYISDLYFANEDTGWICGILGKVYVTQDGGKTWKREDTGTINSLTAIDFVDGENGWVVGYNGTILHSSSHGNEVGVRDPAVPTGFILFPNFPNPFHASTTISYHLPNAGPVELRIYDIRGRQVISLFAGTDLEGNHQLIWDGKDQEGRPLPNGVYFYRLKFGNSLIKTGKMILIR